MTPHKLPSLFSLRLPRFGWQGCILSQRNAMRKRRYLCICCWLFCTVLAFPRRHRNSNWSVTSLRATCNHPCVELEYICEYMCTNLIMLEIQTAVIVTAASQRAFSCICCRYSYSARQGSEACSSQVSFDLAGTMGKAATPPPLNM